MMKAKYLVAGSLVMALTTLAQSASAHHSFSMYDISKTYVLTGVVLGTNPDANHFQIFFAPLNEDRTEVLRDESGEPLRWAVEMEAASVAARNGVTADTFPRGTVFSVGLHPLRNGLLGGGRGKNGLYKCPADAVPAAGKHCDSVPGASSHGGGTLPADADTPSYGAAAR
jgi:hypothetical protein